MNVPASPAQTAPLAHRINPTASRLGISRNTIYRLIAAGELQLVKLGPNSSGITHDSLAKYCASRGISL